MRDAVRGRQLRIGLQTGDKQPLRQLMKLKEAADYLRCSPWRLRNLLHESRLPFLQDGGGPIYIDRLDLDLYIDRNKRYG
jgi:excisionase family DNA binding protein